MITGVSLRSPGVARQMNPQGGLYTVAEQSGEGATLRIVGSVRNVLVASEEPEAVIAAVAAPVALALVPVTVPAAQDDANCKALLAAVTKPGRP